MMKKAGKITRTGAVRWAVTRRNAFMALLLLLLIPLNIFIARTIIAGEKVVKPSAATDPQSFEHVDIDRFIDANVWEKPDNFKGRPGGRVLIKRGEKVAFTGTMKQMPEKMDFTYVHTVLSLINFQPVPVVEHRMFVETPGGKVFPVYVEKGAAAKMHSLMNQGQEANFFAYHLYNRKSGPALMVVDAASLSDEHAGSDKNIGGPESR